MHRADAPGALQLSCNRKDQTVWTSRNVAVAFIALFSALAPVSAQETQNRTIEQYLCKDVMRESGSDRDVAIAFLHGFLLGRSGTTKFSLEELHKQTAAFIEPCLSSPDA